LLLIPLPVARCREAKVTHALDTIGISILNAGGSTLLGTLFIAASRSALFRIFFVFVWGTIALGLVCGLVIIPAALASFGPVDTSRSTENEFLDGKFSWSRLEDVGSSREDGLPQPLSPKLLFPPMPKERGWGLSRSHP